MENLTTVQKTFLIILGVVVVIILIVYVFTKENSTTTVENSIMSETFTINEIKSSKIIVHIAGEVVNEGVIELEENSRINDAIESAGGVTAEADLSKINLASVLKDGQKVYIPSEEEIEDGYLEEENEKNILRNDGKININTATQTEFETLPGVGASTALKIINYRKENGNFSSIEDIKNVPGIGDSKFDNIKDNITVN